MQAHIEIHKTATDARIKNFINKDIHGIAEIIDVYKLELSICCENKLPQIAKSLTNNVSEYWKILYFLDGKVFLLENGNECKIISNSNLLDWDVNKKYSDHWIIEKSFLAGVTDNLSSIVKDIIQSVAKESNCKIKTAQFFTGKGKIPDLNLLFNPLIEEISIDNAANKKIIFIKEQAQQVLIPKTQTIPIRNLSDKDLEEISAKLCLNLNLIQMQTIKNYFLQLDREPYDIELETIAQTWSEHCKHNIFSYPIDELNDGIFKTYIRGATEKIMRDNPNHICASVFSDNAGAIYFDENYLICVKVETHNSPSALEPFGGAMTGVLGVNRDIIGFGMGAKPIANYYAFCFDDPDLEIRDLYRDKNLTSPKLSTKEIAEGVIEGVNVGGNCSGIPTVQGLIKYDSAFAGKPLVFVGSVGIIPRAVAGKSSCLKEPKNGDLIIIVGGRTGRDGIHGATFSSSAISEHNVKGTEVQIGDPFTQKKLSDAIVKEIRDLGLYNAITDNGAGGFSSSIGEMGINGFHVELEKAPLKYPNLSPWEIWVSESQERMTLAVPEENLIKLAGILKKHDVEFSCIGAFNKSEKALVTYNGEVILDLDCKFLHDGNPPIHLKTKRPEEFEEIQRKKFTSVKDVLNDKNIFGNEFIAKQYDHEVQGLSILKPLQGEGKVFADSSVIRPVLTSDKGLAQSQSLAIVTNDPYNQTAIAIEQAIRNIIISGVNREKIALLDNFCWSDSNNHERLYQLKLSAKACYDYSIGFNSPFISGKDSMFNDFKGYDKSGNPIYIRNRPTILITSVGVVDDIKSVISLDAKFPGDLIYIIGKSMDTVDFKYCNLLYKQYFDAVQAGIIASGLGVNYGGRIAALIRKLKAGNLGVEILVDEKYLYEQGYHCEIMVTIDSKNKEIFESHFNSISCKLIGEAKEMLGMKFR